MKMTNGERRCQPGQEDTLVFRTRAIADFEKVRAAGAYMNSSKVDHTVCTVHSPPLLRAAVGGAGSFSWFS